MYQFEFKLCTHVTSSQARRCTQMYAPCMQMYAPKLTSTQMYAPKLTSTQMYAP